MKRRSRSVLVAWLVALTMLVACSDQKSAQPAVGVSTTAAPPVSTVPVSTTPVPAATLLPPPFKSRAAAETREEEWRNIPGSALRECVAVEKFQQLARQVGPNPRDVILDLRSGEWVAGSFYDLRQRGTVAPSGAGSTYQLKIYWIGLARDPQTPVITARSLSDPTRAPIRGETTFASNSIGSFTASGVVIPTPGRWRITAASTDQWGCYDVEL